MLRTAHPNGPRSLSGDESARIKGDEGFALVLTGLLLVPLLALTAISVDVGVWFAQAAKVQRVADLASMAGVVRLPNISAANTAANDIITRNGLTICGTGPGNCSGPSPQVRVISSGPPTGSTTRYQVILKQNATRYFSKVLQSSAQTLERRATAEYNKPVPLGSPNYSFGNNLSGAPSCMNPLASCAGSQPQLWGAIHGPFEDKVNGDPYATKCNVGQSGTGCNNAGNPNGANNPDYRKSGYLWGIDVPPSLVGTPITVQIYDAIHCSNESDLCTGGNRADWVAESGNPKMNTQFEFFDSDGSDLTIDISSGLSMNGNCSTGPGKLIIPANAANNATQVDTYKNRWYTLCTFTPTKSGIHPLQVKSSDIPGYTDAGDGWNAYSLRACRTSSCTTGTQPSTYAINDMSIWNSGAAGSAKFYLANIGQEHAGKRLILDLWDPGDGSGSSAFTMQFRTPPGGIPNVLPQNGAGTTSCLYNATPSVTFGPATPNSSSNCTITTRAANTSGGGGIYNGRWLRVSIQIPVNYTCSADCWWSVWYNFNGGTASERTVWRIQVVGDPVHLVE